MPSETNRLHDAVLPAFTSVADALYAVCDDARALLHDPAYTPSAHAWHRHRHDRTCGVCTAGAFAARRFGLTAADTVSPGNFPRPVETFLCAVDALRQGHVTVGITALHQALFHPQRCACTAHGLDDTYHDLQTAFGPSLSRSAAFRGQALFELNARYLRQLADALAKDAEPVPDRLYKERR